MAIHKKPKRSSSPGDGWTRVSAARPCPVCDGPDNCTVSKDAKKAYCGQVESSTQNAGGQGLHTLTAEQKKAWRSTGGKEKKKKTTAKRDWAAKAERFARQAAEGDCLESLAEEWGVKTMILESLGVGWDGESWTFPERDGGGNVVGINRRLPEGQTFPDGKNKRQLPNCNRGLTYADDWVKTEGPVYVVEGGSDTAAGLSAGLCVVGRASNRAGAEHLAELLADLPTGREIVVLGENDLKPDGDWPGRYGAEATASQLAELLGRLVSWAMPPDGVKDLRDFFATGGKKDAIADWSLQAVEPTEAEPEKQSKGQATRLVKSVVESGAELFHASDGEAYVTLDVNGHKETHRIRGKSFQGWLRKHGWEQKRTTISRDVLEQATGTLSGIAEFDGKEVETFVRIAEQDGEIWVDLADEKWRAVRVTAEGWKIVSNPPIRFVRSDGMLPLPSPAEDGKLAELRGFLNLESDADWILLQAWLVACFQPTGPYPLLALYGEQGSAKSTASRMLRALVDPHKVAIRSSPSDERDLAISASRSWLLCYDNLSHVREWLSDALCRLSTGGGFATRKLYSDDEETMFNLQRPVVLNGISELSKRSDLLDRTLAVTLPAISSKKRKTEEDLWSGFDAARPRILGAILTAVSTAIRNKPNVRFEEKPRMADFAVFAVAAEDALDCDPGGVVAALEANGTSASETAISHSVIGETLIEFLEKQNGFEGTTTDLFKRLDALEVKTNGRHRMPKGWPSRPNNLSAQLNRLVTDLRKLGWEVVRKRDPKSRTKTIRIERVSPGEKEPVRVKRRKRD